MQDNTGVRIVVSDRGPGIAPGSREAVFKPYHRESSSLTEGVSGAGIGLSIARDLARMHGGDLVLLESDGGCVFEIWLPSQPTTGGK
jgi:signal transduction histidine kinase